LVLIGEFVTFPGNAYGIASLDSTVLKLCWDVLIVVKLTRLSYNKYSLVHPERESAEEVLDSMCLEV
jgi:hypothetical protein